MPRRWLWSGSSGLRRGFQEPETISKKRALSPRLDYPPPFLPSRPESRRHGRQEVRSSPRAQGRPQEAGARQGQAPQARGERQAGAQGRAARSGKEGQGRAAEGQGEARREGEGGEGQEGRRQGGGRAGGRGSRGGGRG